MTKNDMHDLLHRLYQYPDDDRYAARVALADGQVFVGHPGEMVSDTYMWLTTVVGHRRVAICTAFVTSAEIVRLA